MKDIRLILLVIGELYFSLLFSGCYSAPSDESIQTAIAETQLAEMKNTILPTFPIQKTITPTPDMSRQSLINEMITLLNQKKYSVVYDRLKSEFDRGNYRNDEEITTLLSFANDMSYIESLGGLVSDISFQQLSPDYSGVYSSEIKSMVLSYITATEWLRRYNELMEFMAPYYATQTIVASIPLPKIGMTMEEVINSRWGDPESISRTITESVVYEQWVYGNGKYIYFENGIVTVIQE